MPKLCRINLEHHAEIYEQLVDFVETLKRRLPVSKVYLFGSFGRGDIHEGSDIDLIIVGDFKERLFKRIERVLELTELPIEPLVYTREEIDKMIKEGNPLILHALKEGKEL